MLDHCDVADNASLRVLDLQRLLCVLPGTRAGTLLLAHLLDQCQSRGWSLIPPRVLTPGSMVDTILAPEGALAGEMEITLAWAKSLRIADAKAIRPLLPNRPDDEDIIAWHALASTVARLHAELAGGRLTFADAASHADRMGFLTEGDRWRALSQIHRSYLETLETAGLVDPHAARELSLRAFASSARASHVDGVLLIGNVDLNAVQRAAITVLADRLAVIVFAPEQLGECFDGLGCVEPDQWESRPIVLDESQIIRAERPEDQCRAAMEAIASLKGRYAAQQITIGLGDSTLAPGLQRAAHWAGLFAHDPKGESVSRSAPARLLEAAADWLTRKRFADFASLLRHPDVESAVRRRIGEDAAVADWLSLLDRYFAAHLHAKVTGDWLGDTETQNQLALVYRAVKDLLAPLEGAKRPFGAWAAPIVSALRGVFNHEDENSKQDASTLDACRAIVDELEPIANCPRALQPTVDAPTALRLMLSTMSARSLPSDIQRDQIEMLGWLEVPLDPAPALLITGFNDGLIPQTISPDGFLPDSLRCAMGLPSNARRYARDAYLLSMIIANRESLTVITGRRTVRGEPLAPSRLLLACDESTLVRRVKLICGDLHETVSTTPLINGVSSSVKSQFEVPTLPQPLPPVTSMSVTAFRTYLACPYRFALRHMLRLDSVDDHAAELDPLAFGSLAHEVLCAFGEDKDVANSSNAQAIEKFLIAQANRQARQQFGTEPLPAVRLQIARLHQRLRAFAQRQAQWRAEGWVIDRCEFKFKDRNLLDIPGGDPMPIRGKIDRIDRHERTGQWRILDYKTGEGGDSPHKSHHGRERLHADELQWLDLQLPLYRHIAMQNDIAGSIELGYIVLPKQSEEADLLLAEWGESHLRSAINKAREVVMNIRAGKFDPNPDFHSPFDDFARLCQTLAFRDDEDDESEDAG